MADVTGPISTLPGTRHDFPDGTMCDEHPDRPAVARIQGETDSFGCEMNDVCSECLRRDREAARDPNIGRCQWCSTDDVPRTAARDYEEGSCGPVYYVCAACKKRQHDRIEAELARYGDSPYDDDDRDEMDGGGR